MHTNPAGSRLAIQHFTEYLEQFPDDLEVRWLLNLAHMTLGEHPDKVDPRFLISLDRFRNSEFDIGKFRDVGHLVGVNRFNQSGGAIMDDFDNDGLLDLVVTTYGPDRAPWPSTATRETGHSRSAASRPAWPASSGACTASRPTTTTTAAWMSSFRAGPGFRYPVRPSLLRNNGDGTFTDVTAEAGLLDPVNSNSAALGRLRQRRLARPVRLLRAPAQPPVPQPGRRHIRGGRRPGPACASRPGPRVCKGSAWIDFDNDDYPDLFLNNLQRRRPALSQQPRRHVHRTSPSQWASTGPITASPAGPGTTTTTAGSTSSPPATTTRSRTWSRACWVSRTAGLSNRLYRNLEGKGFQDMTKEAGLDMVFATMGSNFGDFDNDGFLDFYLGTGDPSLATLVPNRMFKNVAGERFAEITGSSGTGHLQKGHGVACGDWDRDGDIDLFIETGRRRQRRPSITTSCSRTPARGTTG